MTTYKRTVTLNGTDENPWAQFNLKYNPFPQIGDARFDVGERMLNSLDGDPIKGPDDIRNRLKGFDSELIDWLIEQFEPGKRKTVEISWEA